jgi:hypothetical protein
LSLYYAAFRAENEARFKEEIDRLASTAGPVDLAFLPIPEPGEEPWEILYVLEHLAPRHVVLLDPLRRESLFPGVAAKLRNPACKAAVHCVEHPGDSIFIPRVSREE